MDQDWTEQEWKALIDGIIDRSVETPGLTRGRSHGSSMELEIANPTRFSGEEKRAMPTATRQSRAEKMARRAAKRGIGRQNQAAAIVIPLNFEERITFADAIHARGMSISLY